LEPKESLMGLGLVLAGLPVYAIWTRLRRSAPVTQPAQS